MIFDPSKVSGWVGRRVRRTDEDEACLGEAIVLAADDTPYAPTAWIKYESGDYPAYRSVDLSDLEDVETGEGGPRWGTGGPEGDILRLRERGRLRHA